MTSYRQAFAALHSAVLLFALSGLFAKWLSLTPIDIVFGRAFFASIAIALILIFKRQSFLISTRRFIALLITGAILCFHWVSFFTAIQMSTVAIGLLTFAVFPVFVALLEPLFFREAYRWVTFIQATITVVGVYFVLPSSTDESPILAGVIWGLMSALSFALLTILNRKFVADISAKKVAFYQNSFAALLLLPLIELFSVAVTNQQWGYLLILGVVFTALSHSMFNFSLKRLKGLTASIAVSLEPVYGIIAAYFLLGEQVNTQMIVGGCLILSANIWALKQTITN